MSNGDQKVFVTGTKMKIHTLHRVEYTSVLDRGLEPRISCSVGRRLVHWASRAGNVMDASTDGDEKPTYGYKKQRSALWLRTKEEKEDGTCEGTGDLRCDELLGVHQYTLESVRGLGIEPRLSRPQREVLTTILSPPSCTAGEGMDRNVRAGGCIQPFQKRSSDALKQLNCPLEDKGIDPFTSRMLSERSTI